jgi:putative ABC transport system permease protein
MYFLLPLSLAIIHSAVGIDVVNQILVTVGNMDLLGSLAGTAFILVIVYGAYFLATYFSSKSMIRQKDISRRAD